MAKGIKTKRMQRSENEQTLRIIRNMSSCVSRQTFTSFDFESVPSDELWETVTKRETKMHRIHAYPAKFPAFLTESAICYCRDVLGCNPRRIADIFCGCGTTALEARRNGISFWGCDINPIATLIARTKSGTYDDEKLKAYFTAIEQCFEYAEVVQEYAFAPERIRYWFQEEQYNDLFRLRTAIYQSIPKQSSYRNFFLCAFSNILKSTSRWLTKSIKPQIDPTKCPADVWASFQHQFAFMTMANMENNTQNGIRPKIVEGNFLSVPFDLPDLDLIVTSPPYVTSYEYADLHQLSSLWLGFAQDYRDMRDGSIGSSYHGVKNNHHKRTLNTTAKTIVDGLEKKDVCPAKIHSVAKYFEDMQQVANKTYSMLSPQGIAIFVIGNTEYKNIRIDNARHLTESLLAAGYVKVELAKRKIKNKILTPYRDAVGKFTTDSTGRRVYSEEFIVIGRKCV